MKTNSLSISNQIYSSSEREYNYFPKFKSRGTSATRYTFVFLKRQDRQRISDYVGLFSKLNVAGDKTVRNKFDRVKPLA